MEASEEVGTPEAQAENEVKFLVTITDWDEEAGPAPTAEFVQGVIDAELSKVGNSAAVTARRQ